jgi:hypothetical protein
MTVSPPARQGSLFSSKTNTFDTWTRGAAVMASAGGGHENSGQWQMPVPPQIDGTKAPSGAGDPNLLLNVGGGDKYVFGTWDATKETFTPWTAPPGAPKTGQVCPPRPATRPARRPCPALEYAERC